MHPAYSVIFFTTATGAGYGMLALYGFAAAFGQLPAGRGFAVASIGLAYVLIVGGLLSSTFHLGHPERAWRAVTQWRSSWLSREGILALAAFGPTGMFAFGWVWLGESGGIFAIAGVLGAAICGLTVYATSMIYASLRTVRAWADPWVPPVYLVLSVATGGLLANALAHGFGVALDLDVVVLAALAGAGLIKARYWRSIDARGADSTPESATGLGFLGAVRLLDPPHTGIDYLMTEMGFRVARKHALKLRWIAFIAGIAVPFLLTGTAMLSVGALAAAASTVAALCGIAGVLVERWLFFAEAKHVAMLYYGAANA